MPPSDEPHDPIREIKLRPPKAGPADDSGGTPPQPRASRIRAEPWEAALADRLRATAAGVPLREVARLTDTNHETVRRYFQSGRVSGLFLTRFAESFDTSLEWLMTGKADGQLASPRN
jgi:hypothetical protein